MTNKQSVERNRGGTNVKLRPFIGKRLVFTALVIGFGKRMVEGEEVQTLLVRNILCGDERIARHQWFDMQPAWRLLDLKPGFVVRFSAMVRQYSRGNGTVNYGLTAPEDVRVERYAHYVKDCDKLPEHRKPTQMLEESEINPWE